jgi:signal transduction histidine kinase
MDDSRENVFAAEKEILERARKELSSAASGGSDDWAGKYGRLTDDYEKLLKTTMKISKISDILGRMLKEKEQEIQTANANLRHIEELRLQLIQDITHELRTPMATVQGYMEALLDGVVSPDERYLRMVYNRMLVMNRLITDLFQLDKLKANQVQFQFTDVLLYELIGDIRNKYVSDAVRRGMTLQVSPDFGPDSGSGIAEAAVDSSDFQSAFVHADPIRIDQVLSNFIHNAFKYTPDGGEIELCCELLLGTEVLERYGEYFPKELPESAFNEASAHAVVRVTDDGIGIREEDRPFLFDRFYRGAPSITGNEAGSGLGLAISKEIIRRHGGEIGAFGKPGEGSTFFFTLPLKASGN